MTQYLVFIVLLPVFGLFYAYFFVRVKVQNFKEGVKQWIWWYGHDEG